MVTLPTNRHCMTAVLVILASDTAPVISLLPMYCGVATADIAAVRFVSLSRVGNWLSGTFAVPSSAAIPFVTPILLVFTFVESAAVTSDASALLASAELIVEVSAFRSNALCTAVEMGLLASLVLSTFSSPISSLAKLTAPGAIVPSALWLCSRNSLRICPQLPASPPTWGRRAIN